MKICSNGHKTNSGWSPIINCELYYKDATDDYFCIPFEGVFFKINFEIYFSSKYYQTVC